MGKGGKDAGAVRGCTGSRTGAETALAEGGSNMTYGELKVNTEIKLKIKPDGEKVPCRTVKCTVVAKYPGMCIVEDRKGRRRGVAIGELIMNRVVTQEACFESLRKDAGRDRQLDGWRRRNSRRTAEAIGYAP